MNDGMMQVAVPTSSQYVGRIVRSVTKGEEFSNLWICKTGVPSPSQTALGKGKENAPKHLDATACAFFISPAYWVPRLLRHTAQIVQERTHVRHNSAHLLHLASVLGAQNDHLATCQTDVHADV